MNTIGEFLKQAVLRQQFSITILNNAEFGTAAWFLLFGFCHLGTAQPVPKRHTPCRYYSETLEDSSS